MHKDMHKRIVNICRKFADFSLDGATKAQDESKLWLKTKIEKAHSSAIVAPPSKDLKRGLLLSSIAFSTERG